MTRWIALIAFAAVAATGCNVNEYCVDCFAADGDGGVGGTSDAGIDAEQADALWADAGCVPAAFETCNGEDDDCDGLIDNGTIEGVGDQCGTDVGPCSFGAFACVDGALVCQGGVVPTAETCNDADDDCDGMTDEGDPGGGVPCGISTGECQRGLTQCSAGSVICTNDIGPIAELCNGKDDDCDGTIDNGNPEGGTPCGNAMGSCVPGAEQCLGGTLQCVGGDGPSLEVCDLVDNDCDTFIDEDFDKQNDPRNCGTCGNDCSTVITTNGQPGCVTGSCTVLFCFTGWWDDPMKPGVDCDYRCDFAGGEVCNGIDDDCDGQIDEGLTAPSICTQIGECSGAAATCGGAAGWKCQYPGTVSTNALGEIVPESDCDGKDNDCDGFADDFFPSKGNTCTEGLGVCLNTGTLVCNATKDNLTCSVAPLPNDVAEVCDGKDNDCDGVLDNGAPDNWVKVNNSLWIYKYEASRPNASATSGGTQSHRSCSNAGVLPWTNIKQPAAELICQGIGAELCTENQWLDACDSQTDACGWSYGSNCSTYAANTCNGNDYDFVPGGSDQDGLLATGTLTSCYANHGGGERAFDMSGNLKEWTRERSGGVNPLRGGSFNNTAVGISCGFNFVVADDTFQFDNVGFRCCRTTAP